MKTWHWITVVVVVGILSLVIGGVLGMAMGLASGSKQSASPSVASQTAPSHMTREEFKKLVIGRTREEIVQAVGRPDRTTESGNLEVWIYNERTYDPITGKTDSMTQVNILNGYGWTVAF